MARMREGSTTDDYRNALSGEGGFMSLGYEWADKPHRLVHDLCGEIDYLRGLLADEQYIRMRADYARGQKSWANMLNEREAQR